MTVTKATGAGHWVNTYLSRSGHAAPLSVFRIAIGVMLLLSITRFWFNGWIYTLYIQPHYFFPFYGFEFVRPLGTYTYLLFLICGLSALFVAMGWFYRIAIISLFATFTYIELIDKSTYLNHYYFMSVILFMMMFLPANRYFSVDAYRDRKIFASHIPQCCIDAIKFMVCVLYFYAGIAKINSDWLLHALPLKIWLPARNDMPVIGWLFNYSWIHFAFSWFGCLYDLSIGFLLWNKRTRLPAYITVVVFHWLTAILFPIGMFPYVMIVTALIFFSPSFHIKIIGLLNKIIKGPSSFIYGEEKFVPRRIYHKMLITGFALFLVFQLLFPMRYLLYPGELFWTEEGYRFSWRVMLMEKAGYAQFVVRDETGKNIIVNNNDFLTPLQEKMMSTQPDMMLQFAHILKDHYTNQGLKSPQVYVESYVALNGRMGTTLIDPKVDLTKQQESLKPKTWILPFKDEIKGF